MVTLPDHHRANELRRDCGGSTAATFDAGCGLQLTRDEVHGSSRACRSSRQSDCPRCRSPTAGAKPRDPLARPVTSAVDYRPCRNRFRMPQPRVKWVMSSAQKTYSATRRETSSDRLMDLTGSCAHSALPYRVTKLRIRSTAGACFALSHPLTVLARSMLGDPHGRRMPVFAVALQSSSSTLPPLDRGRPARRQRARKTFKRPRAATLSMEGGKQWKRSSSSMSSSVSSTC